jgi:glyoxylase-like metal-dependent hydrolase (beta-lactamase superfamily II)
MKYRRVDFDDDAIQWELLPNGVTILSVPGHTSGTQNVLVQTSEGPVIFASDSEYWHRNWKQSRIPGICYSVDEWMKSVARVWGMKARGEA